MRTNRVISALVGLLALLLLAPTASSGASVDQSVDAIAARSAATYGATAFTTTNRQRVRYDRAKLGHSDCLQRFAVRQAQRMANQTRMFHQDLGPIQNRCVMGWVGENVAMGYPSGWSVVVQGWMRSEGHRANILSRHYLQMAVAARKGADGRWYASQVFGHRL
jgi:uncharacterized protein YkwD